MNESVYWIMLSGALGAGANHSEITAAFPTARDVFESSAADRRISGVFNAHQLSAIEKASRESAENQLSLCRKNGWQCLTLQDEGYPDMLRSLSDAPLVLYVNGSPEPLNNGFGFGVVGTRQPGRDSVHIAMNISAELADAGMVIVSGGALGIDSAAHEGALRAGGKTVAVLGCGLGTRYLMENDALRHRIAQNGAVISEFAPFSLASRFTFPIRNRIISGLSHGILVVEAGERSGSIITANSALRQGRDVFAVPGNIVTSAYAGANRLIHDGAVAVTSSEDILNEYESLYGELIRRNRPKKEVSAAPVPAAKPTAKRSDAALSPKEKAVYAVFGDEPLFPAEIALAAGLALAETTALLTMLEVQDYIESAPGGRYQLK